MTDTSERDELARPHDLFADQLAEAIADPEWVAKWKPDPPADVATLPYDITVGHMTFGKGVRLSTFVDAARRWHAQATRLTPKLTPEQLAAFRELMRGVNGATEAEMDRQ